MESGIVGMWDSVGAGGEGERAVPLPAQSLTGTAALGRPVRVVLRNAVPHRSKPQPRLTAMCCWWDNVTCAQVADSGMSCHCAFAVPKLRTLPGVDFSDQLTNAL